MKPLGSQLECLCRDSRHEILLVAPFVKMNTLKRLLECVDQHVAVHCVTRWRLDEIAAGVSDLDVWLLIKDRQASTLWLRSDLHAKYYRGDEVVLVGSANLTYTALGWSQHPNLEILVSTEKLSDFEQRLFNGAALVDDSLYEQVKQAVLSVAMGSQVQPSAEIGLPDQLEEAQFVSIEDWLPSLRHPEKLFIAYSGQLDQLGTGSRFAALQDLQVLGVPYGLGKEAFEVYVGAQLLQQPIIRRVDQFVETPQRFGAVSDFLNTQPCAAQDGFDADRAWQTLMRWLSYFLNTRYTASTPRHSEIFTRR